MNEVNQYKTLLNLSGGIDSLWCLWNYAGRSEPLLVHHCYLRNWCRRADCEARAVTLALKWIDENEPFDFRLIRTAFDYGNMKIVQDKEVIGFMTGIIVRDARNRGLRNIIISSNKEDIERTQYYVSSESDRLRLIEGVGRRRLNYLYPIADKSKEDLIRELSPDLLELAWFCRTPAPGGKPCTRCKTCQTVLPLLSNKTTPGDHRTSKRSESPEGLTIP